MSRFRSKNVRESRLKMLLESEEGGGVDTGQETIAKLESDKCILMAAACRRGGCLKLT
ncbi:hypothetical protein Ancab_018260 [Ancistrocladus abbreviatus]